MIRPIDADQLRDSKAMPLVLRVFGEFEAPEYSDEGVREFQEYVDERAMEQRLRSGELLMWGYFVDGSGCRRDRDAADRPCIPPLRR